jgi:hypothetical protein
MRNITLTLIFLTSLSCKSQSNLTLEQLIERDKAELEQLVSDQKLNGKMSKLNVLELEFEQTESQVDSILKKQSDFESINESTKEFENYGINWKLNSDIEIPTIIRTDFYKDKLYELEAVFLTDDKNIDNGFESLTDYLRKVYGKEDLKVYSILSQSKENGPFTFYWIKNNRKIMVYRMKKYCYLRISDTSVNYNKLSNIFGN